MISLILAEKIFSLFLIMFMGYAVVHWGLLHAEDSKTLSLISLYLISPCVIISAFQVQYTPDVLHGLLLALAAIQAVFIVLTHGRMVMLVTAGYGGGVLLLAMLKQRGGKFWKQLLIVLALAAVILAGMEGLFKWNNSRMNQEYLSGEREMSAGMYVDNNGTVQGAGSGQGDLLQDLKTMNSRSTIWGNALQAMKSDWKLLLFGTEDVSAVLKIVPHAHNSYLEIGLRWGLPAMLAAIAIALEVLICGLYVAFRSADGWKICVSLMTLCWLPISIVEKYPFCDTTLGGLFLLSAGYLLGWALEERKKA